jgi:hypothetical protein
MPVAKTGQIPPKKTTFSGGIRRLSVTKGIETDRLALRSLDPVGREDEKRPEFCRASL